MTVPSLVTSTRPLRAAVIGGTTPDSARLIERLSREIGQDSLMFFREISSVLDGESPSNAAYDLVVVLERHPDEFTRREALDLIDRFPLARLLVGYNPWCDSDGRTRDVWPASSRVPITRAEARLEHLLETLRTPTCPLPLTASRDETYEFDFANNTGTSNFTGSMEATGLSRHVAVRSPDPAIALWLSDLLRSAGATIVTPDEKADVILWDVDPWGSDVAEAVNRHRQSHPHCPIIGLVGFHWSPQSAELIEAGISTTLCKLAAETEIVRAVDVAFSGVSRFECSP